MPEAGVGIAHGGAAVCSMSHSFWEIICEKDDRAAEGPKASVSLRSFQCAVSSRPLVVQCVCSQLERGGSLPIPSGTRSGICLRCIGGQWGMVSAEVVADGVANGARDRF